MCLLSPLRHVLALIPIIQIDANHQCCYISDKMGKMQMISRVYECTESGYKHTTYIVCTMNKYVYNMVYRKKCFY